MLTWPTMDRQIIEQWRANKVFERSLDATAGGEAWTFYEGPPTANGMPGTHHVEARVFKDVFPRFKTMQGYHVARIAGWDCHGLPVELAVEKELGFTGKPDIEAYGIAAFNDRCRESVQRHVDAFAAMSERMGYWADYDNAYWTMNPDYIESVWWALKTIFDKGLLVEDYRVTPYCPRCGTGLSDHELAQGVRDGRRPVGVRPAPGHLRPGGRPGRPARLDDDAVDARRPTPRSPCTPTSTTSSRAPTPARSSWPSRCCRRPRRGRGGAAPLHRAATWTAGTTSRPFDLCRDPDGAHFVVLADYVTTEDGTGLVHQSPAFGADDLAVCRALRPAGGQPDRRRRALPATTSRWSAGCSSRTPTRRSSPTCRAAACCFGTRRTSTATRTAGAATPPLMYYALAVLVHPHHARSRTSCSPRTRRPTGTRSTIKHGRYGDWLNNNVDWALSRDRYWGTPLPIWRNDADPSRLVVRRLAGRAVAS